MREKRSIALQWGEDVQRLKMARTSLDYAYGKEGTYLAVPFPPPDLARFQMCVKDASKER